MFLDGKSGMEFEKLTPQAFGKGTAVNSNLIGAARSVLPSEQSISVV